MRSSHDAVSVRAAPADDMAGDDGGSVLKAAAGNEKGDFVTVEERRDLRQGLSQRHVGLIAIAGAIGTGLFLGLGDSLATAGPVGSLLAYGMVGLVVCCVQYALGEVTALLPVTGSFVRHAEFLFDPALGFAVGWNLVYGNLLSVPTEISAICVLFDYWTSINASLWIMLTILVTCLIGMSAIRAYGEVEFWFALLKIAFIIFLIILGLVIDLGGVPGVDRIGFRYWRDPGPFVPYLSTGNWGNFLGFWSVLTDAVFSFAGVESLAMPAAETRNPRRAIPKACKRVFLRVTLFYLATIFVVGLLVPSNSESLYSDTGTAVDSPFVTAASAAGIKGIPSVVNAVVITSAWSSSNQALLAGTRVLYSLALKKQAPRIFLRTTKWGAPYMCVLLQVAFMFLAFTTLSDGALNVFYWLVDLTACGVLISWSVVLFNHWRLMAAMRKQNIPLSALPWHHTATEYSTPAALVLCIVILLTNGFEVFTTGGWSASDFVADYIDIGLVPAAYLIWKFWKGTKIIPLKEVQLDEALRRAAIDMAEEPAGPPVPRWKKIVGILWD